MNPYPRPNARPLVFGLAMGALAVAAFAAAGAVRIAVDVWVPVASITAGLLLASVPFAGRLAAWAGVPRARAVAALGALAIAPLLFLGALSALSDDLVSSHWRCGTGDMGLIMVAPFVFGFVGALGSLCAAVIAGRGRPWLDAAVRGLALGTSGVAAALLLWSVARASAHPGPDSYEASLPVVATIPPVSGAPVEHIAGNPDRFRTPKDVFRDPVPGLDLRIERNCEEVYCTFSLFHANADVLPLEDRVDLQGGSVSRTGVITLRHDAAHSFWIAKGSSTVAYRDSLETLTLVDIDVRHVADALSPPPGWIVGAAGGLLLAAFAQARRRREAARLARIATARTGVLSDTGWIALDSDAPAVRAAPDLGIPPGPVLILAPDGRKAPDGVYRGEAPLGAGEVVRGDVEAATAPLRAEMATADALMLAATALTAAPLLAAWVSM